jgi:hypothetical protein
MGQATCLVVRACMHACVCGFMRICVRFCICMRASMHGRCLPRCEQVSAGQSAAGRSSGRAPVLQASASAAPSAAAPI